MGASSRRARRTATLRLYCRDMPGIVYEVSRCLFERGGNIVAASEHHEELDDMFFLRVHFDREAMSGTRRDLEEAFGGLAERFGMTWSLGFSEDRKRMAIMVSRYDHCLYDLLLRKQYGEIDAEIAMIVSNHSDLEPVAESFRIPFFHVPVPEDGKAAAEARTLELFRQHHVDFVVLARYMQVLSPGFIGSYEHRIINIHHGFLPAFQGARPYHQAYARGVKLIGATAHYATEDLDQGPIIDQETARVGQAHSVKALMAAGRDLERRVLVRAVRAHAEDRILVYRNRTIVFD
jgi:formyltetrahydrofolate deformylase